MKYNLYTFLIIASITVNTHAQDSSEKMVVGVDGIEIKDVTIGRQGNPYLNDTFSDFTLDGAKTDISLLRYNHFSDEMEYQKGDVFFDLDKVPNMIVLFKMRNVKYIYVNEYHKENEKKSGYLQVLNEGKTNSLYKKVPVSLLDKIIKQDIMDSSGTKIQTYEEGKAEYYIKMNDGKIKMIPKKKNDFLSFFDDSNIKDFIKKEKISQNSEADLIKLSKFINQ